MTFSYRTNVILDRKSLQAAEALRAQGIPLSRFLRTQLTAWREART